MASVDTEVCLNCMSKQGQACRILIVTKDGWRQQRLPQTMNSESRPEGSMQCKTTGATIVRLIIFFN